MTNQNDFVIDNGTGLAVRQDIQDALQALAGLSSGDSAPSTTYAFQLYANTTSGMLQIRNTANSAFIDLFQLDGTFTLEDGSASTPALAFRDDLNTGIFSSAADTFNVATAGGERLELDVDETTFNDGGADTDFRIRTPAQTHMFFVNAGDDQIGIKTSSLQSGAVLTVNGRCHLDTQITLGSNSTLDGGAQATIYKPATNTLGFATAGANERMRIDSSGNVSIGTTNAEANLHVHTDSNGEGILIKSTGNTSNALTFDANRGAEGVIAAIYGRWNGTTVAQISLVTGADGTNKDDGVITFGTESAASNGNVNASEKMRIDSNGNVGIGTSSPQEILHVKAASEAINSRDGVIFGSTDSLAADKGLPLVWAAHIGTDADYGIASICGRKENATSDNGAGYLQFGTGDAAGAISERLRIDSDGRVQIGATSKKYQEFLLVQKGGSNVNVATFFFNNTQNETAVIIQHDRAVGSTSAKMLEFIDQLNTVSGSITSDGSSTTYGGSSDYRLKENAVAISNAITRLKTLKPYRFNFKVDSTKTLDGFFAHEVQTVVPEAVVGDKDQVNEDNSINPQQLDQAKLVPLLVAAVQELIGKVEALEAA